MVKLTVIVCLLLVQLRLHVNAAPTENVENERQFPQPHCTIVRRGIPSPFRSPLRIPLMNTCGTNKYRTKRDTLLEKFMKRIVGGVVSADGTWPWMVSIGLPGLPGAEHICGGTLISDRWILTAAHCFTTRPPGCTGFVVRLGENSLIGNSIDRQVIPVDLVVMHQFFNGQNFLNDIALMRLSRRVNLAHFDANVVCLPSLFAVYNMASCTVSGWGKTIIGSQGNSSPLLKHLNVGQLPAPICAQKLGRPLLPGTVCLNSQTGQDACQGDSGGPMVCKDLNNRWVQLGVTSHGTHATGRCALNKPAVYTDVRFFGNWIADEIAKNGGA